jgi:hypothetical protein
MADGIDALVTTMEPPITDTDRDGLVVEAARPQLGS